VFVRGEVKEFGWESIVQFNTTLIKEVNTVLYCIVVYCNTVMHIVV